MSGADIISVTIGNGGGCLINGGDTTVKWTTNTQNNITAKGGGHGGDFF